MWSIAFYDNGVWSSRVFLHLCSVASGRPNFLKIFLIYFIYRLYYSFELTDLISILFKSPLNSSKMLSIYHKARKSLIVNTHLYSFISNITIFWMLIYFSLAHFEETPSLCSGPKIQTFPLIEEAILSTVYLVLLYLHHSIQNLTIRKSILCGITKLTNWKPWYWSKYRIL